jgi:hypothetical protein
MKVLALGKTRTKLLLGFGRGKSETLLSTVIATVIAMDTSITDESHSSYSVIRNISRELLQGIKFRVALHHLAFLQHLHK